ncbi:DUF1218 domain-containing protein [Cephalotus follicularis]|uniref:DUF1218 domain-containing protein n=1 Tax=Cephalotus follicularis TaxID=3775 RepID=A0A1Q3DHH9_CEPFO|nr:DUF1218 domain-containing protein [Cephalotus follicularis]
MEKHQHGFVLIFSFVLSLGLLSFASCIIAESKKAKSKDLKLDGKLCYLPGNHSFRFGFAALICLFIAKFIGNMMVCRNCCSRENIRSSKAINPTIATALLFISWFSFGIAVILLSAATSMSRRQSYGKGWLDHECYLVKDGVYIGSGVMVLVSIGCLAIGTSTKSPIEQGPKINARDV